jgi:hypothetical protein
LKIITPEIYTMSGARPPTPTNGQFSTDKDNFEIDEKVYYVTPLDGKYSWYT